MGTFAVDGALLLALILIFGILAVGKVTHSESTCLTVAMPEVFAACSALLELSVSHTDSHTFREVKVVVVFGLRLLASRVLGHVSGPCRSDCCVFHCFCSVPRLGASSLLDP